MSRDPGRSRGEDRGEERREDLVSSDWKEKLTPEQYAITREGATERAFTGKYVDCKDTGMYHCVCCDASLFSSDAKFDSGSGWPSFFESAAGETIRRVEDLSHGMQRTEIRCARCDAHLGHLFGDGPAPTGTRYCVNSASLALKTTGRG